MRDVLIVNLIKNISKILIENFLYIFIGYIYKLSTIITCVNILFIHRINNNLCLFF